MQTQWDSLIAFFQVIPGRISSALAGVWGAITAPFQSALDTVTGIIAAIQNKAAGVTGIIAAIQNKAAGVADAIGETLQSINPFARQSPSLVDNVRAGVAVIAKEYSKLEALQVRAPVIPRPVVPRPVVAMPGISPMAHQAAPLHKDADISSVVYSAIRDALRDIRGERGDQAQPHQEIIMEIDGVRFGRILLPALIREGQRRGVPVIRLA